MGLGTVRQHLAASFSRAHPASFAAEQHFSQYEGHIRIEVVIICASLIGKAKSFGDYRCRTPIALVSF